MRSPSRGAMRPRFSFSFTLLEKRGRRESRAPIAPAVVRNKRTSRPQGNRIIPAFPARMVYGLYVISPVTGLSCHRRPADDRRIRPGWAEHISTRLDASVGASGPHDFAVRARLAKALAGPRAIPPVSSKTVCSAVRPPAGRSLTEFNPPCNPLRARRCRVHCIPFRVVDVAQRPSVDRTRIL
jgi:hypothetical protein